MLQISNHDVQRVSSNYGPEMVDSMNLLTGVLPGIQLVYYGDEIGMEDTPLSWEQVLDPWTKKGGPYSFGGHSRDSHRSPMQWDDSLNAGNNTHTYLRC